MKFFQRASLLACVPATSSHIIFDEVGALAGAVSYTHVAINVDFTSILTACNHVRTALQDYDDRIAIYVKSQNDFERKLITATQKQLSFNRNTRLDQVERRIVDIQKSMPSPAKGRRGAESYLAAAKGIFKATSLLLPQANGLGVIADVAKIVSGGVFGNFLSIFSPHQLGAIRNSFQKMLSVITSHDLELHDNDQNLEDLKQSVWTSYHNALRVMSDYDHSMDAIDHALDDVAGAMQQVQHRRLAIELLSAEQLADLYRQLEDTARRTDTELLTTSPSHLFQLETSFMFDGHDAALLLHVPMIPPNTLSTLFKLRPFPIPFTNGDSLIPKETPELLAISNTQPTRWNTIYQYNLISCSRINNIYVCPGQGILRDNPETTCLGALYGQQLEPIKELCDLDIIPEQELALQLYGDVYLLYALRAHQGTLTCPSTRVDQINIPRGISRQNIPAGCHLDMDHTTVYSQFNLKMEANVKYEPWTSEFVHGFGISDDDIEDTRIDIAPARRGRVSTSEVFDHKIKWYKRKEVKTVALVAVCGMGVGFFAFALVSYLVYRQLHRLVASKDVERHVEISDMKQYVRDKVSGLEHLSRRSKKRCPELPTPPSTPPGVRESMDQLGPDDTFPIEESAH